MLEQSLSIDNLFVFVLLFGYFKARLGASSLVSALAKCIPQPQVPKAYEAKVLEYGILGAAGLRAVFIGVCAFVAQFECPA